MELITYLLKVSACTVLFFAFYLLVLRRLTFFKINRFYLLFTLLLSFIIPTLNFTIKREVAPTEIVHEQATIVNKEISVTEFQVPNQVAYTPIVEEESFDWYSVLPYFYFGIVACLLIIGAWRILQLVKHAKNGTERINGLKIVSKTNGFTNCSFFNYVFIDNENLSEAELQVLLKHEQVHAKQLHSIDKIILIVAKAFLWFNPVVYLFDKALEQAHEYEADEATSQSFGAAQYANLLLRLAIVKSEMPLVHNFVKSPIKERIKMLFNAKSKHMKKLLYLLALPVGLALIWGFTVKVVEVSTKINKDEKEFILVLDAGHGGKDNGAKVNGFSEKDLTLLLSNKIKALAETKGIKVVTTRNEDQHINVKERIKAEGDILISLHVNSEPIANGGQRNGIEMFIPSANGDPKKSLKANYLSHYVFEGLENIKGINIKDERKAKSLILLRESKMPSLVLELGYLTNKNDLKFITNEAKQNELADGIVKGVLAYKQNQLQNKNDDQNYKSKTNSDDMSALWGKTLKGKVKSILETEVGEVLNFKYDDRLIRVYNSAKGKVSVGEEVYITIQGTVKDLKVYDAKGNILKELDAPCYGMSMMKTLNGTVLFNRDIKVGSKNAVINHQEPITTQSQSFDNLTEPTLLSGTRVRVDNKTEISYVENGKMEIFGGLLLADELTFDHKHKKVITQKATFTDKAGKVITGDTFTFDYGKGTYDVEPASGNRSPVNKKAGLNNLNPIEYSARDSVIANRLTGDIFLYGNAKVLNNNQTYQSDMMVYNKAKETLKARGKVQVLDTKFKENFTADSLDMNLKTGIGLFYGKSYIKF